MNRILVVLGILPILIISMPLLGDGPVTQVTAPKIVPGSYEDLVNQAENFWKNRYDRKSLERALKLYEEAYKKQPERGYFPAVRLSWGYYFMAEAFDRGNKNKMLKDYEKGKEWGIKALQTNSSVKAAGEKWYEAAQKLGKDYIEAMYWTAVNLGKWSKLYGILKSVFNLSKVKALMKRVTELDRTFFYGAPDRYWGAFYAAIPGLMGGSLSKSKEHFEKSLKIAPYYLETKVLYAEFYAVKKGDKKLFKELLNEVLKGDVNVYPDVIPEQKVAKDKARELLKRINELF